ncbi:9957_t:CDS:1, partial [Acaulospora colombiana]
NDDSGDQRLEWSRGGSRVGKLVKGTALQRKDTGWKWNAINMHVHDCMVIIAFLSGYAIGFPDYRKLINKDWNLNDDRACWVLGVDKWCDWSACDGKRVVFAVVSRTYMLYVLELNTSQRDRNVILNLHELPNKMISVDTPIVEISRGIWE